MKRLTNHFNHCDFIGCGWLEKNVCRVFGTDTGKCHRKSVYEKLREYENAEEQGLLLRLPCKVGDTLWWTNAFGDLCSSVVNSMFIEQGIDGIVIETLICNINGKEIGKTVFLTKEEAEQALAKMKEV